MVLKEIKKILCIFLIIFLVMPTVLPIISIAATRPNSVRVVTDETEKEILLGTTSNKARRENILGLASKFSLFTKGDVTLTGADAEGKIASGGTITANTSYTYEAGTEVEDERQAKIIAQNGMNSNFNLTSTKHTTRTNNSLDNTKKIAVVGTNASNMNWDDFSNEDLNQIVASDLIDFDNEFDYLQEQSNYLTGLKANGIIKKCYGFGNNESYQAQMARAVVFSGNNETLNVFNMTTSEFNNIFNTYPNEIKINNYNCLEVGRKSANIFFDVPKGSYIIINIMGEENVKFSTNIYDDGTHKLAAKANIYFLADDEDLSRLERDGIDTKSETIEYAFDGRDFLRDENENLKAFKMVFGAGKNNELFSDDTLEYSQYLLYNLPQAKNFEITNSMFGSILAPRAVGTDNSYGYTYGTIACNSYSGGIQFGYIPNTIELDSEFDIKISKIDSETNKNISNVQMEIMDLNGNIIKSWTTGENISTVTLKNGKYILKEIKSVENYTNPEENLIYFTVKGNKYNKDSSYIIEMGAEEKEVKLEKLSCTVNSVTTDIENSVKSLNQLYYRLLENSDIGSSFAQELEFEIDTNSIENIDDLYYIVASNGWGILAYSDGGSSRYYQPTDWVEFKKWTKVTDGITVKIPVINNIYSNSDRYNSYKNMGMKVHFYTSDGTEITDEITLSSVKIKWYTTKEEIKTYNTVANNVTLNEQQDTLILTNDHIKTTIELTKQSENSTLLPGAIYEIQDSKGKVIETFSATATNGKSKLEDLRLDVGTYYLVEKQAPEGYKLSEEKIEFTVKPHTSETITKTVTDEKIKVDIEKQDEYGNTLEGANLSILDSTGTEVRTWQSTNEIETIENLPTGKYTLHENYAPAGFIKANDIKFEITPQGKVLVDGKETEKIVLTNKTLKGEINIVKSGESLVEISKLTKLELHEVSDFIWGQNPIENVVYGLYAKEDIMVNGTVIYKQDTKIATAKTGVNGVAKFENLPKGEYYVIEEYAPNQYEVDTEKHDISLIVTYDAKNNQVLRATANLTDERKQETVEITKTEKGTETKIEGAVYGLYNQEAMGSIEENTLLDVVTTDKNGFGKFQVDLPVGNYYIKEIEAPEGYLLSEESKYINFKESTDYKLSVEDDYVKVIINKIDKNGENVEGAKLQIIDKEGNVIIPEWTTDAEPKQISKILNVGQTYTLQETKPADGYVTANDKDFVVLNTGDNQNIEMIDYTTKIEFAKVNTDNQLVQGAKLKLVQLLNDETEREIETWITGTTTYQMDKKLIVGKKYKVYEEELPNGYVTADPVEFTVKDTDQIQEVKITDDKTKINIYKQDENGNNIEGAVLQLLDSEKNVVEEWISTQDAHEIIGKLSVGKEYTITEKSAPAGYVIGQDKTFTVEDTKEVQEVKFNNKATKVEIAKVDEDGNYVEGAKLQLIDGDKQIIDTWETTDSAHGIENRLVLGNTYILQELEAPNGYTLSEDKIFTVKNEESIQLIEMIDKKLNVTVEKVNEDNELIEGAKLQIVDNDENIIESWTSTKEAYIIEAKLQQGETYILQEIEPADGYVTAKNKSFIIANTNEEQKITMIDEKTSVSLAKYDENGSLVSGAKMQVVDEEENVVEEWITGNTVHDIIGKLIVGKTYTLKEIEAPEGYVIADDIEFTVEDTTEKQNVNMTEFVIAVAISKVDEANNYISGADLELLDKNGNVVEEWTTINKAHLISNKLSSGSTYTLKEVKPADGYITAEDIEFKVENTGKVQEISMVDKQTKVSILKVDENSNPLSGATMQLWDEDGKIIDEWITSNEAKEFIGKLVVGKTYKIKETKAPDGYTTSLEKTFVVEDKEEMQEVVMTDNKTKVTISKKDITTNEELPGAKLVLKTVEGEVIEEWISTDKTHEINGTLAIGKPYILTEETAPNGYVKAENITFTVSDTDEVQKVEMKDDYTKVKIEKLDENNNRLKEAELQITDKQGSVIEKWTTDGNVHEINKKLIAGQEYILEEINAPTGYEKAEKITFKVSENGKEDVIRMVDKKQNIVNNEEKQDNSKTNLSIPKTGQTRLLHIAIVGIILVCIASLLGIRKDEENK